MQDIIFREYDIRGKVGSQLIIDNVGALSKAIAYFFKTKNPQVRIIALGMDGRTHSQEIKERVCDALLEDGFDVMFIGICPSPAYYFAMHNLKVDAGIMITASHNPKEYNGMKICLGTQSVWGPDIQEIKNYYHAGKSISSDTPGTMRMHEIVPDYIAWLTNEFQDLKGKSFSVVFDCGNAATSVVIPQLIKEMEWHGVTMMCCELDGKFPNHDPDPTVMENMMDVQRVIRDGKAYFAIGFDGDGDRMSVMTNSGKVVPGDRLLGVFAKHVLITHPKSGIVFDVKASDALIEKINEWGGRPIMSACGHSIIKNKMLEEDAVLAGELSCHFFFKDRHPGYDDGIYAALRLLEIIDDTVKTIDDLIELIPERYTTKEYRIACKEQVKPAIIKTIKDFFKERKDVQMLTIDGVRLSFDYGWALIRPSNTQSVLSMRFEAENEEIVRKIKREVFKVLSRFFSEIELQEII